MCVCVCVSERDAIEPASELASAHSEQTPREGREDLGRECDAPPLMGTYILTFDLVLRPIQRGSVFAVGKLGKEGRKEGLLLFNLFD